MSSPSAPIQINVSTKDDDDKKRNRTNLILNIVYFVILLLVLLLIVYILYKIYMRFKQSTNNTQSMNYVPSQNNTLQGGKGFKKNKMKFKLKGGCGCAAAANMPN